MNDHSEQFLSEIEAAIGSRPDKITADGGLHRFSTNGKKSDDSGWYILHTDGLAAGAFGCWRASVSHTWRADIGREFTPAEADAHRARMATIKAAREADEAKRHADAAAKATGALERAQPASADHPYAVRKGVSVDGLRQHEAALVIPMRDSDGTLSSLQFIALDGGKKFLTGGRVKGCFHMIGEPGATLCIAEGWATGASIHAATGQAVAVAFNAGNLEPVAEALRTKYPQKKIIICGDVDASGVGQAKAQEAAKSVGGAVALPSFTPDELACDHPPTDFNDLAALRGLEAVAEAINAPKDFPPTDDDAGGAAGAAQPAHPVTETGADMEKDKKSTSRILLDCAAVAGLFHIADGQAFADLPVNGHRETLPLHHKNFRSWLTREYFLKTGGAPNSEAMAAALAVLEARARYEGPCREVFLRTAEHEGRIYIDLTNEKWQVAEISAECWRVVNDPPVRFRRAPGMAALPMPENGGKINELRGFLNVANDADFALAVSWLLAALRPGGPYPILGITGEQGSAKSTFAKIMRSLVDPNDAPLRTLRADTRDMFVAANSAHALVFDNLSGLSAEVSDCLCRLSTGGGFSVRALYTDSGEAIFSAIRPIILNGISDFITRPDLGERSIILTLGAIPENQRKLESGLWRDFERERPRILGALLDAMSHGLRRLPETKLERLPRMADFAHWATACETAFWPSGTFTAAFDANRAELIDNVIAADPVASALLGFMDGRLEWQGGASELLGALAEQAGDHAAKSKYWPRTASALSGRIKRAASFLRVRGIEIEARRSGKARMVHVYKQSQNSGKRPSSPSPASHMGDNVNQFNDLALEKQVTAIPASSASPSLASQSPSHAVTRAVTSKPLKINSNDGDDGDDGDSPNFSEGGVDHVRVEL